MGYWTERAIEHRRFAEWAADQSARAEDVDVARDWLNTSIDRLLLAEACERSAALYDHSPLPGFGSYPARRALTAAVLGGMDFIDAALHAGERRSIKDDRPCIGCDGPW
jgi:hypothetical protein